MYVVCSMVNNTWYASKPMSWKAATTHSAALAGIRAECYVLEYIEL